MAKAAESWRARKPPFSGVFDSFASAGPAQAPSDQARAASAKAGVAYVRKHSASTGLINVPSHLPIAASLLARTSTVKILDFGGAGGVDFANLIASTDLDVKYHVVELPAVCAAGREIWANDPRISFSENMPDSSAYFDLIYSWGAIHYVEDPMDLLRQFARLKPRAILIEGSPFAIGKRFVRMQGRTHGKYPQWVSDLSEAERVMRAENYRLIFRASGKENYNVDNFDPAHRVASSASLLFVPSV